MDQGFNDEELSDIMKEIEALEDDFKAEDKALESNAVMKELSALPQEKAVPAPKKSAPAVVSLPKKEHSRPGTTTMAFKVSGDMDLELNFTIGGKSVDLHVSEDGLSIEMEGGMTFKLPVGHKKAS